MIEIKHYKDLSAEDKKKYETAKEKLRHLNSSFGFHQYKDGSWGSDVVNVLWGVLTPTGRVSKAHWQTLRFDMRRHSNESVRKGVEKANAELHNLPNGYKWLDPIFFEW